MQHVAMWLYIILKLVVLLVVVTQLCNM